MVKTQILVYVNVIHRYHLYSSLYNLLFTRILYEVTTALD
jgi:hypothetical protein